MADDSRPLQDIDADLARWNADLQHSSDTAAALDAEAEAARHLFDTAAARWRPDVWKGKAARHAHSAFDAHRHDASHIANRIQDLAHQARGWARVAQQHIDGLNLERQQAMQHG